MTKSIQRVGIVGCGVMGKGIAQVCALANMDVRIAVRTSHAASVAFDRLKYSIQHSRVNNEIDGHSCERSFESISFTTNVDDLGDRQLIIESITENFDAKSALLRKLDESLPREHDIIIASNTSSIPITKLARTSQHSERVIGIHFFNPATRMLLVELVESLRTDPNVVSYVHEWLSECLGKVVVRCRDRAGFIVNSLLIPYLLSAIRMLETGFTGVDEIDKAMKFGCGHPIGPIELVDHIGLDVVLDVAESLHSEYRDQNCCPPPMLVRMVEAGFLGKKCGRGFYTYSK